jgi:hypothetical protein
VSAELNIELRVVRFTLEFGQQSAAQFSRFPALSIGAPDGRGIRQRSADDLPRLQVTTLTTQMTDLETYNHCDSDTNLRARHCVSQQRAEKTPVGACVLPHGAEKTPVRAGLRVDPPPVNLYGGACAASQFRDQARKRLVAEYALSGIDKPIGIAEYELVKALPEPLDTCLPSVETLEAELSAALHDLSEGEGV